MRHLILGTAGHVDHGKTTLIKALTNIDCDTHQQEKERGITINLGFSHLQLPSGNTLGIIDVPGHKDFINTMISGASSIDIALLVIAADSGIMPQTVEHIHIIKTLGINTVLVALNKADLVDEELIALAQEEIEELFIAQELEKPVIIPVSAITKLGLETLIEAIDKAGNWVKSKPISQTFRMYIDRLFTVKGMGSVVTGSVISGRIEEGDSLNLYPNQIQKLRVKTIQRHGISVKSVQHGDRAAINLSGIKKEDFQKGAVLSNQVLEETRLIDAYLNIFDDKIKLKTWSNVIFYSGTFESLAKIHLLNKDAVEKGEDALVQIHLDKPSTLFTKDKFIIRNTSADRTIGGGFVLDTKPLHHRKRTSQMLAQIEMLFQQMSSEGKMSEWIFVELSKEKLPVSIKEMAQRLDKTEAELISGLNESSSVQCFELESEKILIRNEDHEFFKSEILNELNLYHQKYCLLNEGVSSNFFNGKFQFSKNIIAKKYIEYLLKSLQKEGILTKVESTWALKTHQVNITPDIQKNIEWLEQTFLNFELQRPILKDIDEEARRLKISKDDLKMYYKYLVSTQKLVKFQDEFIHAKIIESIKNITVKELQNKPSGINLSEFRALTNCSKKIIPLLIGIMEEQKILFSKLESTHTIISIHP